MNMEGYYTINTPSPALLDDYFYHREQPIDTQRSHIQATENSKVEIISHNNTSSNKSLKFKVKYSLTPGYYFFIDEEKISKYPDILISYLINMNNTQPRRLKPLVKRLP